MSTCMSYQDSSTSAKVLVFHFSLMAVKKQKHLYLYSVVVVQAKKSLFDAGVRTGHSPDDSLVYGY